MRRFSSLRYAAAETRRILRDRFACYLPVMRQPVAAPRADNFIPDEQLLDLLLNLHVVWGSDIDRARATYDAALPPNGGEPSFDEVIAAGWLRVVWGRIATPFEIDQRTRVAPDANLTALAALLKKRFEENYAFNTVVHGTVDLQSIVTAIERGDLRPELSAQPDPRVGCRASVGSGAVRLGIACR